MRMETAERAAEEACRRQARGRTDVVGQGELKNEQDEPDDEKDGKRYSPSFVPVIWRVAGLHIVN